MAARAGWKQVIVRERTFEEIANLKEVLERQRGRYVSKASIMAEAIKAMQDKLEG